MSNESYLEIMNEILEYAKENNTFFQADFELTANCNFNCKFCYVSNPLFRNKNELSTEEWKKIIDECIEMGVLCCEFTGGEAITRHDYTDLYKYAYDSGLRIEVLSNGFGLNRYIDLFKGRMPEVVSITMYGGSDDTYRKICGVDNGYTTVTKNILEITKEDIPVTLKIVANPEISETEYVNVSKFAESLNVPIALVKYISPMRSKEKEMNMNWRMDPDEIKRIDSYFLKEDIQVSHCVNARKNMFDCGFARTRFAISHKGDLFGCLACTGIQEKIDFKESITEKIKKIRLTAENISKQVTVCDKCEKNSQCSKCPGLNYSETGSFDECTNYIKNLVELQVF